MEALLLQYNDRDGATHTDRTRCETNGARAEYCKWGNSWSDENRGPNIFEIAYTLEEHIRRTGT